MEERQGRVLCGVLEADLVLETQEGTKAWFESTQDSPLLQAPALRESLKRGLKEGTYVWKGDFGEFYAAYPVREGTLYLGPLCSQRLRSADSRRFYQSFQIDPDGARILPGLAPAQIRDRIFLMLYFLQNAGDLCVDARQMEGAIQGQLQGEMKALQEEQISFVLQEEEENDALARRHSYQEEQLLMAAVREGRGEDVIPLMEDMDRDEGRLSGEDLHHFRNLAIIGISLCSRAAIEGGLSPEVAYRVSGFYIQKCDRATQIASCLAYRNEAVKTLAGRVREELERPVGSSYVEQFKDYVRKHYREKILLEEVAGGLGVSAGYLSRLFKKETGTNIQEYINEERVYRASNLLLYSDLSLAEIAQYVHFPTQSYFGQVFKRYKGMTPRAFRSRFRTREFIPSEPPSR